jgi:hypothetical protein
MVQDSRVSEDEHEAKCCDMRSPRSSFTELWSYYILLPDKTDDDEDNSSDDDETSSDDEETSVVEDYEISSDEALRRRAIFREHLGLDAVFTERCDFLNCKRADSIYQDCQIELVSIRLDF